MQVFTCAYAYVHENIYLWHPFNRRRKVWRRIKRMMAHELWSINERMLRQRLGVWEYILITSCEALKDRFKYVAST